jgi:hypothetical protein
MNAAPSAPVNTTPQRLNRNLIARLAAATTIASIRVAYAQAFEEGVPTTMPYADALWAVLNHDGIEAGLTRLEAVNMDKYTSGEYAELDEMSGTREEHLPISLWDYLGCITRQPRRFV